ncbi:hypothetical protein FOZ60_007046 [Perkinsus olseni]|uniref:Choline transporter-like protein n=2 Tax=Perkinsus olseni TaxID=32597 RepID=A0A7J6NML5_PEROL|nr:hypothetical protein FOZ60_007046 [Perkinsus olseni]
MTAALQKRELIFCLSNGEDRVRRCIRRHSCARCKGKVPPGLGVSCFVAAITAEGGIVDNFTPAVQNVLRELDSCCDHYGRVAIDLVFKVMNAARGKVQQKDLQLWEDLFGGSTACIVQTTFEQGLSHWMSELGIDFIAANDMIRALLGVIDPYSTGIIQRDAFVESMGLCGGSDLLCAENLPIILSWAAERGKKAANLPSCPERSRARSLSSIPRPIHALKSEYPVAVVRSEVSEVPPSSPDEVLAISSSRYCDATDELDCSRSSRCRSDQSPAVHAYLIARALRRPTQRRLWSSLVRLSSGLRLDREDAVRVRAIASLLRLSTIRRIAWGFSRMQTQVMGLNLEPQSRPGSLDHCCIAFFWSCALTQLICGIVIASTTNYTHPVVTDPSQLCPSNYNFALADCVSARAQPHCTRVCSLVLTLGCAIPYAPAIEEAAAASTVNGSRILQAPDVGVAADLWEALADYWYIPTTIFPSMVLVAVLWLLASEYIPRALIWSTLATSIVFLVALWAFWNFEYGFNNWMLLVIAGLATVSSAILYKSINRAAEVLSVAACGLRSTPSVVLASLLLKGIFVAYVLLWTFFMVRSAQAKELDESNCSLRSSPGIGFARFLFGLLFWIFTYVFLNMKTVVCAAGIGAWYFPGGDGEPTIPAFREAFNGPLRPALGLSCSLPLSWASLDSYSTVSVTHATAFLGS